MWEYSINLNSDNIKIAKYIYSTLKTSAQQFGCAITSFEENGFVRILIGCEEYDRVRMQYIINDCIIGVISTFFKEQFLDKYLCVPLADELHIVALKKALAGFDKETDYHLIQKSLTIENSIFLESFFDFRLTTLKSKWLELIKLANENSAYLLAGDTFVELLKFLIENLEVCYDQVNVLISDKDFKLFDGSFGEIQQETELFEDFAKNAIISNIISLCPKNINIYCDSALENPSVSLLCKIFEERTKILPTELFALKNS